MDPATMSYAQLLRAYQALQERVIALENAVALQPSTAARGHETPRAARTGATVSVPEAYLTGGGEMGQRIRMFDWSATPLGPVETWPQSLKTAVSICIGSRYPIVIWWGNPAYTMFYNDAYISFLGSTKHPGWLGRSGRECWSEIWPTIGPMLEGVFATGEATWSEDLLLVLHRNLPREEGYFTFSYSPIRDDAGKVGGIFCACYETTGRVIGERRLQTLRTLGRTVLDVQSAEEACEVTAQTLTANSADIPFALIYLLDAEAQHARLVATTGPEAGSVAAPERIAMHESAESATWPLRRVFDTAATELVADLAARCGPLPGGPWPESPETALILPIATPGQTRPTGFLVAGLSPRRVVDADYRSFCDLIAGHVGTAIANARAYEAERKRVEALAELDRAKTAFFSNVSHEFRTPLTLMLGPLEDILAKPADQVGPDHRELLTIVHRNSLRLLRLVNTLLDFSRIEAGRMQAVYEPTDLAMLTADLASNFRSACERAGLRLVVDCPSLLEPIYVDREMWEKIVLNLLSNAFKFTFDGEITATLRPARETVELAISDTGTGIPAAELSHLFERFYRVADVRGRTQEGTGIGLALVQELVHLHGGSVRVESTLGRGSTFLVAIPTGQAHLPADRIGGTRTLASTALGASPYIEEALRWLPDVASLPLMPAGPGAGLDVAPASLPAAALALDGAARISSGRARIVWADDNADMRDYVRRLLSVYYDVEAVVDGQTALAAVRARRPDLVLADVMMPQLDGFGLLRTLRADPEMRALPVILLSARAGEESRIEGLEMGADDYLVKPFSARELLARVSSCLELSRLRARIVQERTMLAELFRQTPMPIAVLRGPELVYDMANLTYLQVVGGRDILRKPLLEALPELHGQGFDQLLHGVRQTGVPYVGYEFLAKLDRQGTGSLEDTYWTFVCAPLLWDSGETDRVIVIANEVTESVRARQQLEIRAAEAAADQMALQQAHDALEQRVQERTALVELIQDITRAANEALGSTEVLQYAVHRICAHTGWPVGHAYLAMVVGIDRWASTAIWHLESPERYTAFQQVTQTVEFAAGEDMIGRVGALGKPEWHVDVSADFTFRRQRAALEAGLKAGVAVPILIGHEVAGVLEFYAAEALEPHTALLDALAQIGTQLGRVVERDRAAEQLQRQQEVLVQQEKLAAMSTMLASVAHELNNPLAIILMQAGLLREDLREGPLAEPATEIVQAAGRCERLVRQFLTLARQHPPERSAVALNSLVVETVELLAYPLRVDNVTVHLHLDDQLPLFWGDPHQLQQVLLNLLTNAQQALRVAPGAREVTLTTQYDPTQHRITLVVADTGPGIPPALQGRIFEPFFTTKPPGVGTGLGLPLCRGIIEAHGGTLEVTSIPGYGATFRLMLPVGAVLTPTLATPSIDEERMVHSHTILIIDDELSLANGLARLLRRAGHTVETVANGRLALAELDEHMYDLIMCDMRMPEIDGPSLYRLLERQKPHLCSRFIFLTGDTLEPATQTFLEQSGAPCLTKPFSIAEARRVIQRALYTSSPATPAEPCQRRALAP